MNAEEYLKEAIKAIGDRAKERDIEAERSAARAAKMFSALTGKELTELEAWQFMCCLKLVRSATGKFKADDFVDLAGYAALAGEASEKNRLSSHKNPEPYVWHYCKDWNQEYLNPDYKVRIWWYDPRGGHDSMVVYPIQCVHGWGNEAVQFKIVKGV